LIPTWRAVTPTGKRGRQPAYSEAAIQTRLTMKFLLGMTLGPTTGSVQNLLFLIGQDCGVPDFGTLSHLQKTLALNIPHRGWQDPLRLRIDSTRITEGEARASATTPSIARQQFAGKPREGPNTVLMP
jgi:hypothetical protein